MPSGIRRYTGEDGELPPLVVLSHGGPTSMTTNIFSLNVQWWTSRGFGVVDVNYGGSTGYGRDYRQMLDGHWGIVDVEDCTAAARFLVERGLADGRRLVIRGGSAGGFTTLAALTSSNVFKAGASLYGVADLMLLAKDTHKFESRYLDGLIGPLPEARALYDERSPIHHLDRLACPIIFFQGVDDKTVPPNQAETMVEAMAARNLPVAYYLFEGEGHGFRKAETLRRVLELELDFYGRVFGFTAPDLSERVVIRNMGEG
jgi:dipeptidyl aminopeptidase/acylaminoacyl peptidase